MDSDRNSLQDGGPKALQSFFCISFRTFWDSLGLFCWVLIFFFSVSINSYFSKNNYGVEFFVESEPEQAIVYVKARGNLALSEKDALVQEVEEIVLSHPGIKSVFAFAGAGGLNSNTSGAAPPEDTIGQIQLETIPWADRADNQLIQRTVQ